MSKMTCTSRFMTCTQYSETVDDVCISDEYKGHLSGFFSILNAFKFLNGCKMDAKLHKDTIKESLMLCIKLDIHQNIEFNDLMLYMTIKTSDNVNIKSKIVDSSDANKSVLFANDSLKKYATIIHKNGQYFTILIENNMYYVRDCNAHCQYNFNSVNRLYKHLDINYNFGSHTIADEVVFSDDDVIQSVTLTEKFDTVLYDSLFLLEYSDECDDNEDCY